MPHLFCFGFGYTARFLADTLGNNWTISGTSRTPKSYNDTPISLYPFDTDTRLNDDGLLTLKNADSVLISIPPDNTGDMIYNIYHDVFKHHSHIKWIGYCSTTGVYGDHDGAWVDENTTVNPQTQRAKNRIVAENQWLSANENNSIPAHIFRISGIYGPGRNPFTRIQHGHGRIIEKPGHVFNRIHVDDIARVMKASIHAPAPGTIYNLADDEPASNMDVMYYAYKLLGRIAPDPIPYDTEELSPMARGFYAANKRVNNNRMKALLNAPLIHPTYREGLTSLSKFNKND